MTTSVLLSQYVFSWTCIFFSKTHRITLNFSLRPFFITLFKAFPSNWTDFLCHILSTLFGLYCLELPVTFHLFPDPRWTTWRLWERRSAGWHGVHMMLNMPTLHSLLVRLNIFFFSVLLSHALGSRSNPARRILMSMALNLFTFF